MHPRIEQVAYGYAVEIPDGAASGAPVRIRSGERDGVHVLHAESPDRSEIYFELTVYPDLRSHEVLADSQCRYLRQHANDASTTAPETIRIGNRAALAFEFRGTLDGQWKVRRFLFMDDVRTYRVVYDPRSSRNEEILTSLELGRRS
jgi:hypothetical protein